MTHKRAPFFLILTLFAFPLLYACNNNLDVESGIMATENNENTDTVAITLDIEEDSVAGITTAKDDENNDVKPEVKRQVSTSTYGGKETLYISTYGANGKVWGHVTMNGKTGHGTIHDDNENSYSITVTRHGGELYGTDQNGRQYVFRL
mgnify:CR=1 FL=1